MAPGLHLQPTGRCPRPTDEEAGIQALQGADAPMGLRLGHAREEQELNVAQFA